MFVALASFPRMGPIKRQSLFYGYRRRLDRICGRLYYCIVSTAIAVVSTAVAGDCIWFDGHCRRLNRHCGRMYYFWCHFDGFCRFLDRCGGRMYLCLRPLPSSQLHLQEVVLILLSVSVRSDTCLYLCPGSASLCALASDRAQVVIVLVIVV
jgi:hypothetical protein